MTEKEQLLNQEENKRIDLQKSRKETTYTLASNSTEKSSKVSIEISAEINEIEEK